MHPYSSIDTTTAWKKQYFILSVRSEYYILYSEFLFSVYILYSEFLFIYRVLVGYENGPRNLKESDRKLLNKNSRQTILTGAILSRSFQDDLRRRAALKRDSKLSLESFTESKSESDLTPFGSLQEATKLGRKFLQAAFLNDTEKTNTTIDKRLETVSRDSLNNPHLDGTSLPAQLLGETSENRDKNKSGNVKSTENTVRKKSDLDSNLNPQLLNNISSVSSFSFRLTPTDIRKNFISSSTSVIPNSSRNTAIELPVLESSTKAEFTSKQGKVISLLNTKALASTYQTVKPFRISTTTDPQIRTSRQPELSSLPTTDTTTLIIATDLKPKVKQTSTTIYKTSKSKHITSPLRTSAADTNIITTISTDVESTASSLTGSTIQTTRTQQQTTFPERTPTSKQKSTDYGRSAVTTSSSQPTTTTTIKEITSSLSLATSKTPTYETPVTTRRIVTVISESPTWSSRLSTSVTTSALTTSFWKNVTISNSSVPANTSTNSTLENETTTFLSQRTHENEVQEEEDAYFWPLVLSLVIGIPAIIVFSIAMVVITKKRSVINLFLRIWGLWMDVVNVHIWNSYKLKKQQTLCFVVFVGITLVALVLRWYFVGSYPLAKCWWKIKVVEKNEDV